MLLDRASPRLLRVRQSPRNCEPGKQGAGTLRKRQPKDMEGRVQAGTGAVKPVGDLDVVQCPVYSPAHAPPPLHTRPERRSRTWRRSGPGRRGGRAPVMARRRSWADSTSLNTCVTVAAELPTLRGPPLSHSFTEVPYVHCRTLGIPTGHQRKPRMTSQPFKKAARPATPRATTSRSVTPAP